MLDEMLRCRINRVALLVLGLCLTAIAAAPPVDAQVSEAFRRLFGRGSTEEAPPQKDEAQAENAAESDCPEIVRNFRAARTYPQSCGKVRPPEASRLDPEFRALEGVWEVRMRGSDGETRRWFAALSKGLPGVGYRDPDGAWSLVGKFRTYPITPTELTPARIRTDFFDRAGGYQMVLEPSGSSQVMRGRWTNGDESALVVWRKAPPGRIRSISFDSAWGRADGTRVVDSVAPGGRPGRFEFAGPLGCGGGMRGNCHEIHITLAGENLAAPHEIWLDPASHMELAETRFLFPGNGSGSTAFAMKGAIGGEPPVEAIRLSFNVWDRATSGPEVLWFDGRPIPFDFIILSEPERPLPGLLSLTALDRAGSELEALIEGAPFRLRAEFEAEHEDPWIATDLPGSEIVRLEGNPGEGAPTPARTTPQAVLWRTEDRKSFESGWLTVKAAEPTTDDEP